MIFRLAFVHDYGGESVTSHRLPLLWVRALLHQRKAQLPRDSHCRHNLLQKNGNRNRAWIRSSRAMIFHEYANLRHATRCRIESKSFDMHGQQRWGISRPQSQCLQSCSFSSRQLLRLKYSPHCFLHSNKLVEIDIMYITGLHYV